MGDRTRVLRPKAQGGCIARRATEFLRAGASLALPIGREQMRGDGGEAPAGCCGGGVGLRTTGALVPTQGKQQPPPILTGSFRRFEVQPMGLRQLKLTQLAHNPQSIGMVQHLLKGPQRFFVIAHLNQPQRLRV